MNVLRFYNIQQFELTSYADCKSHIDFRHKARKSYWFIALRVNVNRIMIRAKRHDTNKKIIQNDLAKSNIGLIESRKQISSQLDWRLSVSVSSEFCDLCTWFGDTFEKWLLLVPILVVITSVRNCDWYRAIKSYAMHTTIATLKSHWFLLVRRISAAHDVQQFTLERITATTTRTTSTLSTEHLSVVVSI